MKVKKAETTSICPKCGHMEFTGEPTFPKGLVNESQAVLKAIQDAYFSGTQYGLTQAKSIMHDEPIDKEIVFKHCVQEITRIFESYIGGK
jgi:hypothetical protein